MLQFSHWNQFKNIADVKARDGANFPFERFFSTHSLLQNIRVETKFGYVQCNRKIHMKYKQSFPIFHQSSKLLLLPETILVFI